MAKRGSEDGRNFNLPSFPPHPAESRPVRNDDLPNVPAAEARNDDIPDFTPIDRPPDGRQDWPVPEGSDGDPPEVADAEMPGDPPPLHDPQVQAEPPDHDGVDAEHNPPETPDFVAEVAEPKEHDPPQFAERDMTDTALGDTPSPPDHYEPPSSPDPPPATDSTDEPDVEPPGLSSDNRDESERAGPGFIDRPQAEIEETSYSGNSHDFIESPPASAPNYRSDEIARFLGEASDSDETKRLPSKSGFDDAPTSQSVESAVDGKKQVELLERIVEQLTELPSLLAVELEALMEIG